MTQPRDLNPGSLALKADALTARPTRRYAAKFEAACVWRCRLVWCTNVNDVVDDKNNDNDCDNNCKSDGESNSALLSVRFAHPLQDVALHQCFPLLSVIKIKVNRDADNDGSRASIPASCRPSCK